MPGLSLLQIPDLPQESEAWLGGLVMLVMHPPAFVAATARAAVVLATGSSPEVTNTYSN